MSRLTINSNIASLNAQRHFGEATSQLSESFTRLSSGLRINKASDDAAGLAVSSLLTADKRIANVGIRNINDGISYLNVAEGALSEMTNIVTRITELAEQGANGTLGSKQGQALQQEVAALQSEYNRIINSTAFNGKKLLTGLDTETKLQGGYGTNGQLLVQVGAGLVSEAFGDQTAGETTLASTSSSGVVGNGASSWVNMSDDGNFITFTSTATNLVAGVSGSQIYLKNLSTGQVSLVSSSSSGTAGSGISSIGKVSGDGRYVSFQSDSNNLVAGVSGSQIYFKDLLTGQISVVSSDINGISGNGASASQETDISSDGRYVSFFSTSTNLVSGVSGTQTYIKEISTGKISLVSSSSSGVFDPAENSYNSIISEDGKYVTFTASSPGGILVPGVTTYQIYRKNLETGVLEILSSDSNGITANSTSAYSVSSADNRYVAFYSTATNLVSGVSGGQTYLKDTLTGNVSLVSSSSDGTVGSGGTSFRPQISANGRYVTFRSTQTNLVAGVTGNQFYRKDTLTGELILVSRSSDGSVTTASAGEPASISADGKYLAFASTNSMDANDTNGVGDIYIREISSVGIQELEGMAVSNNNAARTTLTLSKKYAADLTKYRAGIGASLSRASSFLSSLQSQAENYSAAASQITDTDVAEESSTLVKTQILQKAAGAVLAQANLQPELVLNLLKGL